MIPPEPSFHSARTRPARAKPQMAKIINIRGVYEASPDPKVDAAKYQLIFGVSRVIIFEY